MHGPGDVSVQTLLCAWAALGAPEVNPELRIWVLVVYSAGKVTNVPGLRGIGEFP